MIRVGFVCDSFEIGGQERTCLELLRRLDRERFEPHLYLFRPGSLLPDARELGIPIAVGHTKPGADPGWTPADDAARRAWKGRLAERLAGDRIDVCLVYAWADGIAAARAAGIRAIVERADGPALTTRIADKSACQRIICESRHGRDILLAQRERLGCHREQTVVIPNGVDLVRFDPRRYDRDECRERVGLRPDDVVIGTVGRLAAQKNLVQLLRAAQLVLAKSPHASRVQVIIAGPDRGTGAELLEEAHRLGIAERVRFLGPRADVPEVLRAFDVFVQTSLYEGTPSALLEAMAMALPIVANPVGAVVEVVRGNGYLVPVLHPEDTARAMTDILDDPELAARLGRRSRRIASRRYDVDRMIRGYEDVLLDALHASAASSLAGGRVS